MITRKITYKGRLLCMKLNMYFCYYRPSMQQTCNCKLIKHHLKHLTKPKNRMARNLPIKQRLLRTIIVRKQTTAQRSLLGNHSKFRREFGAQK